MPDKINTNTVRAAIKDTLLKLKDIIPHDTHICNDEEYNINFSSLLKWVSIEKYKGVISYD